MRQLYEPDGSAGNLVGWLEDESIAARNGHWKHPQGNHAGKIKRSNADANTDGVAGGPAVHTGSELVHSFTHHEGGRTAGEFDALDPALKRSPRLLQGLAVFFGDECDDLLCLRFQELAVAKEKLAALD